MSMGFKRGSLVVHKKLGLILIGGFGKFGISLHSVINNKRIYRKGLLKDLILLSRNNFLVR